MTGPQTCCSPHKNPQSIKAELVRDYTELLFLPKEVVLPLTLPVCYMLLLAFQLYLLFSLWLLSYLSLAILTKTCTELPSCFSVCLFPASNKCKQLQTHEKSFSKLDFWSYTLQTYIWTTISFVGNVTTLSKSAKPKKEIE